MIYFLHFLFKFRANNCIFTKIWKGIFIANKSIQIFEITKSVFNVQRILNHEKCMKRILGAFQRRLNELNVILKRFIHFIGKITSFKSKKAPRCRDFSATDECPTDIFPTDISPTFNKVDISPTFS